MAKQAFESVVMLSKDRLIAVAVAIISGLVAFAIGYTQERARAYDQGLKNLSLAHDLRKTAIEDHIASDISDIFSLSHSPKLLESFYVMDEVWSELGDFASDVLRAGYIKNSNTTTGIDVMEMGWQLSEYRAKFDELEVLGKSVIANFNFYDVFLMRSNGDIVFSVAKEDDFGTNLIDGPYARTPLAFVFQRAIETSGRASTSFVERYAPSNDEPAMFVASAIRDNDGRSVGVFAAQLELDAVDAIARAPDEVIADLNVAVVSSDFLLLAGTLPDGSAEQLKTIYRTGAVQGGFAAFSGETVLDDDAGERLSVYSPLVVGNQAWIIVSEMPMAEIRSHIRYEKLIFFAVLVGIFCAIASRVLINILQREKMIVE